MKRSEAVRFFGSQKKLANALNLTHQAVQAWGETIPRLRQLELERITRGALKADHEEQPGEALSHVFAAMDQQSQALVEAFAYFLHEIKKPADVNTTERNIACK